mgnify:CR=1 FL=1
MLLEKKNPSQITEQNWRQHPKIVEIKKLTKEVKKHLEHNPQKQFSLSLSDCEETTVNRLTLFPETDALRMLQFEEIVEDISRKSTYYYDHKGAVRMVAAEYNRSNEESVYISSTYFDEGLDFLFKIHGLLD